MTQSIGREKAIALAKTEWWKGKSFRRVAKFQLFTDELCCPFEVFHEAIEKALGRPVYTHEFGLSMESVRQEFLGERDAPTLQEILELIPEEKRIVIDLREDDTEGEEWKL